MNYINFNIEGSVDISKSGISEDMTARLSNMVLDHLYLKNQSISVIITDNDYIKKINKKYRNKNSSTDVISFAYNEEKFPMAECEAEHSGDIFISIDKASEQADEFGLSLHEEYKRLLIHGILHLYGFDHEKGEKEKIMMEELENQLACFII